MSPRPYHLGKRQEHIDESRRRVLDVARSLLVEAQSFADFTVEAVARRADVARATVYYQFGSKTGLLEALCDALAEAGRMGELAAAFATPDPTEALRRFIATFGVFWAADRPAMRRLRALAALDADVGSVIAARDERRRAGLAVLVGRLSEHDLAVTPERAVRILHTLTSFETFDTLAGPDREGAEVTQDILRLAQAVVRAAL